MLILLTHYDYNNMGRTLSKNIMTKEEYTELSEAFWKQNNNLVSYSTEYEGKIIHGSLSTIAEKRLKQEYKEKYIKVIRELILENFKTWEWRQIMAHADTYFQG